MTIIQYMPYYKTLTKQPDQSYYAEELPDLHCWFAPAISRTMTRDRESNGRFGEIHQSHAARGNIYNISFGLRKYGTRLGNQLYY